MVPPVSGARKDGRSDVSDMRSVASDGLVLWGNKGVVPLSVEAEEFSLKTGLKDRVPTGEGSDVSENSVPSRESPEGVVGRSDVVVSTTAVAGAASPTIFAGRQPRPTLLGPMFRPLPRWNSRPLPRCIPRPLMLKAFP